MSSANIYHPGEVIEQAQISLEWKDIANWTVHPRVQHPRSKGVHVSGIVKVIAEKRGLLKGNDDSVDDMPTVVLLGQAWEECAARLYPSMNWQPGEIKRDGIVGSPDGWSPLSMEPVWDGDRGDYYREELTVLDEFKLTYKSNRNRGDIRGESMWMMQVMSYLWMNQEFYDPVVRLHVLWACNDYVMPFRPTYIRYLIRFTQEELKRNWAMMLKYKQFATRE